MSNPSGITGPQDLAQTVHDAVDPLQKHAGYGNSANAPDDEKSRAAEMQQLITQSTK